MKYNVELEQYLAGLAAKAYPGPIQEVHVTEDDFAEINLGYRRVRRKLKPLAKEYQRTRLEGRLSFGAPPDLDMFLEPEETA